EGGGGEGGWRSGGGGGGGGVGGGWTRSSSGGPVRFCENHVASLLADHVNGRDDEKAGDAREHRGVHDPQLAHAVDAEGAVHDATVPLRPDLAGAAGVVAPGLALHELGDRRIVVNAHPR